MSRTRRDFSYRKGVCLQCTRCTLCCRDTKNHTRHILLLNEEARKISKIILKPVEAFATDTKDHEPYSHEMRKTNGEGRCIFLEGTGCSIYEQRPLVCRFYPFELKTMKDGKHAFANTAECPGIGKGKRLERGYFENLFKRACIQLGRKKAEEL